MRKTIVLTAAVVLLCFTWWVNADTPLRLMLDVEPVVDTMTAGDSATFIGTVIDNMDVIHHEFDTCIHWSILPADSKSRLSTTAGSQVTYYAVEAYQRNIIVTSFTDPVYGRTLVSADTIYVKPGMAYREFIEPYPLNGLSSLSAPIDSIVLSPPNDTLREIAAVFRDKYGNFLGFDFGVMWQELNDSGIIKVQTPDTPYVCRIESRKPGVTYVVCRKAGLTIGTVKVIVRPGAPACPCGMSLAIRPHNDTIIASGDSLRLAALILDDTAGIHHEYDTLLAWSLVHNGIGGRLKTQSGSPNTFYSDSGTGLYRIAVMCTDVSKFPVSWPLLNRSDTVNVTVAGFQGVVNRMTTRSSAKPPRTTVEYYSLRGQKLTYYGIRHTDRIVLERIIGPDGNANIRRIIYEMESR